MSTVEPGSEEKRRWTWDPSLYAGSASHDAVGRVAYPIEVAHALVAAPELDGSERLLDVGCGPGSLTLLLAPHVAEAIGVDADVDMLTEAARHARANDVHNVSWRHLRGEDLPADLPTVHLVTFAQSFHLFGDRFGPFEAELRQLLVEASDEGWFGEQMRSIALDVWR